MSRFFESTNGFSPTVWPPDGTTINSGRPVFLGNNGCTDCNTVEVQVFNLTETVFLDFEPDTIPVGKQPNAVSFADFFGPGGGGNEGSGGDISASGLPVGDYLMRNGVGKFTETFLGSCGNGACPAYTGIFNIDFTSFSVGANTSTSVDLFDFEIVGPRRRATAGPGLCHRPISGRARLPLDRT